jgi:hypothetical protein
VSGMTYERAQRYRDEPIFSNELASFDTIHFSAFQWVVAFRVRGQRPVLGPNPLPPGDPDAALIDRCLALLDWGAPDNPAPRLARDAFLAASNAARDPHFCPLLPPRRPVDADGRATHVAWLHTRGVDGTELREADSPYDVWPGAEADGPLGRPGFWVGTTHSRLWVGAGRDAGHRAMSRVHQADLAGWSCRWEAGVPARGVDPGGAPNFAGDILVQLLTHLPAMRPAGEFRAFMGGDLITRAPLPCVVCGSPAHPWAGTGGAVYLCNPCGETGLLAAVAAAGEA